jgi:hypothetical protein
MDGTGVDDTYYLYRWVGIDGYYWNDTCDALIQAGTGFVVSVPPSIRSMS